MDTLTNFADKIQDPNSDLSYKYKLFKSIPRRSRRVFFAREILPDKEPAFVSDPEKMNTSFNFIFARSPFSRIPSAYYDLGNPCMKHEEKFNMTPCLGWV